VSEQACTSFPKSTSTPKASIPNRMESGPARALPLDIGCFEPFLRNRAAGTCKDATWEWRTTSSDSRQSINNCLQTTALPVTQPVVQVLRNTAGQDKPESVRPDALWTVPPVRVGNQDWH